MTDKKSTLYLDLYQEIYGLIRQIPLGRVSTPRDISEALGDARANRAVLEIIRSAEPSPDLPVHRVVSGRGKPLHPGRSGELCLESLRGEGVEIVGEIVAHLEERLFRSFVTSSPLRWFRELQEKMAREVVLEDRFEGPVEAVAGVDVAYRGRRGFGACVVMDRGFGVLEEVGVEAEVSFPYISSYLALREGPLIMRALEEVEEPFQALMINGHGIAHPRGCGLATHIGLILKDKPTIGVAARRLVGEVGQEGGRWSPLEYRDRIVGAEIRRRGRGAVYVSPGNNITLERSLEVVEAFLGRHRLPEPLWRAHNKARALSRGR
ncbi:MAG: endonuclease V [Candidatus Bathyarchaeia archaeon]